MWLKNARDVYNFRNKIINEIKKEKGEYVEDNEVINGTEKLIPHRPEEDIRNLISNIANDTDLENEFYLNNAKTKLLEFLNYVINKKINSKEEASKLYVNNFLGYKQELENKRLHEGSRSQSIKKFIEDAEYIEDAECNIFGILFSPEQESKKLDPATGGYAIDEGIPIPAPTRKTSPPQHATIGHGLKIMIPSQLLTRLQFY